jgi:8-oxo-dGTP pyrophosphatase MutT (NUDIX family)
VSVLPSSSPELRVFLAERLARIPHHERGFTSDLDMVPDGVVTRDAAVLIPIVVRSAPQVLLTLRPDNLPRHPGQIAFPGGQIEADDPTPAAAALREAREEVGLDSSFVDVVGTLPPFVTGTGFRVAPIVALVQPGFDLTISPREVVEAFEVPFDFLMDPTRHVRRTAEFRGRTRTFYEITFDRHRIWGVTAGIVVELYRALLGRDA